MGVFDRILKRNQAASEPKGGGVAFAIGTTEAAERHHVDDGVRQHLSQYAEAPVVGPIVRAALAEESSARRKAKTMKKMLSRSFPKGSLTYAKFAAAVDSMADTVLDNVGALSERLETFDVDEYRRLRYLIASGLYREDGVDDRIEERKDELMRESKAHMQAIVDANEMLLLEMEHLSIEISKLSSSEPGEKAEQLVEEVARLAGELEQYRQC